MRCLKFNPSVPFTAALRPLYCCFTAASLFITFSLSCATISPHQNFKDQLKKAVGTSIEDTRPGTWVDRRKPINVRTLTNGNVEYTYLYVRGRSCEFMFEVNPSTRIIVNARFEGKESDCVINP